MTIEDSIADVKERRLSDPMVSGLRIIRERATLTDSHLRARLTCTDGSQLEFSEYVQRSSDDQINVITYSFHWVDAHGNLVQRWDNTPHFPDLPDFPHHVHTETGDVLGSGQPVSIFVVLDEVAQRMA